MKIRMIATVLAAVLVVPVALAEAPKAKIYVMDASEGKSEGHLVGFAIRPARENAPIGLAVAATGHETSDDWGSGFGMILEGSRPAAKGVTADEIQEVVNAESGARPVLIYVEVTKQQQDEVKALIKKWSAVDDSVDGAGNVAMNFGQEVLDALGLKRPYRSGLGGSNAVQWFGDIPAFNRTAIVEETE